jgi:hypothetical protein
VRFYPIRDDGSNLHLVNNDACPDEDFALSKVSDEKRGTAIGGNENLIGLMNRSGLEEKLSTLGV